MTPPDTRPSRTYLDRAIRQTIGITIQRAKEAAKGNIESLAAPAWRQHHPHALAGDGTDPPPYRVVIDDAFTPTAPVAGPSAIGIRRADERINAGLQIPKERECKKSCAGEDGKIAARVGAAVIPPFLADAKSGAKRQAPTSASA